MNTRTTESISKRPLRVDFASITDNDADFKQEVVVLMIDNLEELQRACELSLEEGNPELFHRAAHKVKTTMCLLADAEFDTLVDEMKYNGMTPLNVSAFNSMSAEIIASLRTELFG